MSRPSNAKLHAFAQSCINVQLDIAHRVRRLQNADYVLFDANYHRTSVIRIGNYRVDVDAFNRKAVMCRAANESFTFEDYHYFIKQHPLYKSIKIVDDKAYLTAKPHVRSTIQSASDSDDDLADALDKVHISD